MFSRELVLRPNCLLTRRPLQIITRPHNILYRTFSSAYPWKHLEWFLYQHGYQVERIYQVSDLKPQSHILCDIQTYTDLLTRRQSGNTVTVVSTNPINCSDEDIYQISIEPQKTPDFYSKILDHCIALAEIDYLNG